MDEKDVASLEINKLDDAFNFRCRTVKAVEQQTLSFKEAYGSIDTITSKSPAAI